MNRDFVFRIPRTALLCALFAAAWLLAPAAQAQDWATRSCKSEVGARIADLPLSEITVETSTTDGEGNAIINWRTTRGSAGFCRVNRQGNIILFRVEEMARPAASGGQADATETGYVATCRAEVVSRLGVRESDVFVRTATRSANETELTWRVRRGAIGDCTVDNRGRITAFEIYRREGTGGTGGGATGTGTGTGTGGGTGTSGGSVPYTQRVAYDSGYSWGEDDRGASRTRDYRRRSDLFTAATEAMFRKGYEDGYDRRVKDYTLPPTGGGTGTGTGTGTTAPAAVQPGRYGIEFVASGKLLDLRTEDGTTVQQWSGSFILSKRNQLWDISEAGGGYYYIRSAENGRALTARGATNGSAVVVEALSNRREQQWRIKVLESGELQIISRLGLALDLPDGNDDNGVRPHLWQEHGRENQRFRLKTS